MTKNYLLSSIGICILILLSIFSIYLYNELKIYESLISISILLIGIIILSTMLYFSKKISLYNIGTFIMILTNITLIFNIIDINSKNGYVTNLITNEYSYNSYNLYVQRKNPIYNELNKLENKNIGILLNNEDNVSNYLENQIRVNIVVYKSVEDISTAIESGEIQGFLINEKEYNKTDFDTKYKVKSIHHNKIKEAIKS